MKKAKQLISVILCAMLVCSVFVISAQAKDKRNYVKSISIKKKATVTIPANKKKVTKSFKVSVKVNGKASKKFTAKSNNKSVASVKVSGSTVKVTAKKAGTAKIKVTTKAKNLKKKKLSKTLTIKVKKGTEAKPSETPSVTPTEATTQVPTEGVTEDPTDEPEYYGPAEIDPENVNVELKYTEYANNDDMGFATDSATGAVSYRDQNADYTFEIADKNIVKLIKDEDGDDAFCSVSVGKTTVEVYEQFPGQEKKHLGTLNVNVTKATMANVCEDAFSKETENTIKLKANFGQESYDFGSHIKSVLDGSKGNGLDFGDNEYKVTYEPSDNRISVDEKGVATAVKNGETQLNYVIKFVDNSVCEEMFFVEVSGKALERVDGYTIDNVRDYIVGVDTPVKLADGTEVPLVNFDNAATTPAFKAVQDAINQELEMYGSIGRGFSQKSNHSTDIYNSVRDKVLEFFTADPDLYTCFYVNSTTDGLNKLASALVESEDDIVLTTRIEHHANDLSWRERCKVIYAEVDEQGRVIYDDIEKLLKENKVKIVSISAASNVTGYVNDVHRVAKLAHKYGAKIVVDGAQIVAHRKFYMMGDLEDPDDDIDFIAFSAHKMYSPYGGGAVVGLTEELNQHMPEFYGGGTIMVVGDYWQVYKTAPAAYEAGSPNYPGVVGLGKAIDVLTTIGMDKVEAHEKVLNRKIIDGLKKLPNVILYGDCENIDDRVGVVSFNFSDINTYYLAAELSGLGGVATRRGAFCAHPYVWRLMGIDDETARGFENCTDANTAGMIRVSFGIYNNEEEIDKLLDVMPAAMQAAKDANPNGEVKPEY